MTQEASLALFTVATAVFVSIFAFPAFNERSYERRTTTMRPVRRRAFHSWLMSWLWAAGFCPLSLVFFLFSGFQQGQVTD